jgi:hypothetical protein
VVQENTQSILEIRKQVGAVSDAVDENEEIIRSLNEIIGQFKL